MPARCRVPVQAGWIDNGACGACARLGNRRQLPTTDGTSATAQAGCLIVLDNTGKPAETFYGSLINGPWDMAAFDGGDEAALFVTNVLNGTVTTGVYPWSGGQARDGGTHQRVRFR